MNRYYQPATHRVFAGFAAVFMTAATLAVTVIAPTAMDASSREVSVSTMSSEPQSHASINSGALTTSIDVVAYRTTRLVPVVQTRVQSRNDVAS